MHHQNYHDCNRDYVMDQHDDFHLGVLVSDCPSLEQEYDCYGKPMWPDSAASRFGEGHLWLDVESVKLQENLANFASRWLLRLD